MKYVNIIGNGLEKACALKYCVVLERLVLCENFHTTGRNIAHL